MKKTQFLIFSLLGLLLIIPELAFARPVIRGKTKIQEKNRKTAIFKKVIRSTPSETDHIGIIHPPKKKTREFNFFVKKVRGAPLIEKPRKMAKKSKHKKNKPKKTGKNTPVVSPDPENLPDVVSPSENKPPLEKFQPPPGRSSREPSLPAIQEPDERAVIGPSQGSWDKTRDIFSPGGKSAVAVKAEKQAAKMRVLRLPELQGVIKCSDKDEMAILDNRMVRKGSEIDGFRVVKINKNSVVLNRDGEEIVLNVKQ